MRPAVRSITADVEVRSPSGRVATIMGMLCTVPVAVGMLVACTLPSGDSGGTGVIVGRAFPPAAQEMLFAKDSLQQRLTTGITAWVQHEVITRPTPPAPAGLSAADMAQYTSSLNALRQTYPDNNFTQVFGARDSAIAPHELMPLPLLRALGQFVVASEVMAFQTTVDFRSFSLLYASAQNQSGYISETVGDTSRTTTTIGRETDLQPGLLTATMTLTTQLIDAENDTVATETNSFPIVFTQSRVDRVPVGSETVSGDPTRTGTTSSHVERIIQMTAPNNEHELEMRFNRLGQYMGQTLTVKHLVDIAFDDAQPEQATGYLGTIPSDSIEQSGIWRIHMRETGYGSALNESEAQWVEENVTP